MRMAASRSRSNTSRPPPRTVGCAPPVFVSAALSRARRCLVPTRHAGPSIRQYFSSTVPSSLQHRAIRAPHQKETLMETSSDRT